MPHMLRMRLKWLPIWAVVFLLMLSISIPTQAAAPMLVRQGATLGYEETDCPFPALDGVTCGYMTVPEDRTQPDGYTVQLAVAIINPYGDNPDPVPVIYLDGGPGSAPLLTTDEFMKEPITENHTLILFDQRGTGFSIPSLNCPEAEGDQSSGGDSTQACHDRLQEEGVDLQMYNSAASAADVNDLVAALGYDQVNLWGISYGTKLGLTILRDFPQIVQSAVLDSVYAPETDDMQIQTNGVLGSLTELFNRCAADNACNTAYPNLESDFYAMLDRLDTNPVSVDDGNNGTVTLDGATAYNKLFETLYDTQAIPYLPYGIELLANAQSDDDTAAGYGIISDNDLPTPPDDSADTSDTLISESDQVQEYIAQVGQIDDSEGMALSVDCQEEYQLDQTDADLSLANTAPAPLNIYLVDNMNSTLQDCQTWDVQTADPIEAERVSSDVPTLLFAGQFDPITPVSSAQSALEGLSNGQLLIFPSAGHGITYTTTDSGACAKALMIAFLDDPSAPLDTSCIDSTSGIDFYVN